MVQTLIIYNIDFTKNTLINFYDAFWNKHDSYSYENIRIKSPIQTLAATKLASSIPWDPVAQDSKGLISNYNVIW